MNYPLYNVDSEQSLVGAAMIDNAVMTTVAMTVQPEDFTVPELRAAWGAMINLAAKHQPCDIVTVTERLEAHGQLGDSDFSYLAEIVRNTPSATNARAYAEAVADLAQRRKMLGVLNNLGETLYDRSQELPAILSQAQRYMESVRRDTGGSVSLAPVSAALPAMIDRIDRRFNGLEQAMGRTTGLSDLDDRMMGLCPGLHILGARPSMGKTAAMLSWAAADLREPSLIESLEMPEDRLIERLMAMLGNMPLRALKDPRKYMDEYWPSLTCAVNTLKDAPLYIDAKSGATVEHIRRQAMEIADRHGKIGFIGVDYLQKVPARGDYGMRYDRAIGEVAEDLKKLGDELKCPVVALSQLNRALEQRPNKRPVMSDLKESSVLEQEAETITFIYRDEVYNPDNPDNKGLVEFISAKNRDGETGTTYAVARLDRGRFENLASLPMQSSGF